MASKEIYVTIIIFIIVVRRNITIQKSHFLCFFSRNSKPLSHWKECLQYKTVLRRKYQCLDITDNDMKMYFNILILCTPHQVLIEQKIQGILIITPCVWNWQLLITIHLIYSKSIRRHSILTKDITAEMFARIPLICWHLTLAT